MVHVGQDGVTPGVVAALEQALWDHELVKVKLASDDRDSRRDQAGALATETGAQVAQVLGRTVLLYRPNPDAPRIEL
ncbi:MAG TPA: YhbY family RNA-binding protein [Myxococcaceae bacterium]|nr:YhbY family RNA-binding protein [Myxococcaceae bacterium]